LEALTDSTRTPAAQRHTAIELASQLNDPRLKLFVTSVLLRMRAQLAKQWNEMDYVPLDVAGERSDHLIAYSRAVISPTNRSVVVLAPRLWFTLAGKEISGQGWNQATAESVWEDTTVGGPIHESTFVDVFTGAQRNWSAKTRVADLLGDFPVAVLVGGADLAHSTDHA
ncbi:MAG TPA: hypothetical protein VGJ26_11700, partial [Pirellulales bacterium]